MSSSKRVCPARTYGPCFPSQWPLARLCSWYSGSVTLKGKTVCNARRRATESKIEIGDHAVSELQPKHLLLSITFPQEGGKSNRCHLWKGIKKDPRGKEKADVESAHQEQKGMSQAKEGKEETGQPKPTSLPMPVQQTASPSPWQQIGSPRPTWTIRWLRRFDDYELCRG